jgi:hypothetical protein
MKAGRRWSVTGALVLCATVAWAEGEPPKKKDKKEPPPPTAADFLGDFGYDTGKKKDKAPRKNAGNDDLGSMLNEVKIQKLQPEEMAPRSELSDLDATVAMKGLFLAPKIMIAGQGCVMPKGAPALKVLEAPDLPYILNPFSVCAHLESNRGRAVQITFKIMTPKGRSVATSDETVDFGGKKALDHVVDFPELHFPVEGRYIYRMEVEGVVVSQQELLEIRVKNKPPAADTPAGQ